MKNIITLFVVLLLTQPCITWSAKVPANCEQFLGQLQENLETQKVVESSLVSLMKNAGVPRLPLSSLFINVPRTPKETQKIIDELRNTSLKKNLSFIDENANSRCLELVVAKDSTKELIESITKNNSIKINFLALDQIKRNELTAGYKLRQGEASQSLPLINQLEKSYSELAQAEEESQKTTNRAAIAQDLSLKQVLESKLIIENKLTEIEKEQVQIIKELTKSSDVITNLQKDLVRFEISFKEDKNYDIKNVYIKSIDYWRIAADELFHLYNNFNLKIDDKLPNYLYLQVETSEAKELYSEYVMVYEKFKNRRKEIVTIRLELISELKAKTYRSLNDAGQLRSQMIRECRKVKCTNLRIFSNDNIKDLIREIKLVPLKISSGALSKILEFRLKMSVGIEGWVDLATQMIYLFFIILIPFILTKSLKFLSAKLEAIKKNLFSKSMMNFKKRTLIAKWITRLNPFIPQIGMLIALFVAEKIIINTDLKELVRFFYYLELYYYYKITRLLLTVFLELLFLTDSIDRLKINKDLAVNSAKRISRIIFIELFLLHITQDAVRKAYTYNIISQIILVFNIFGVFIESNRWKKEILKNFENKLKKIDSLLVSRLHDKYIFLLLPLLLILLIGNELFNFISSYLIRLDSVKRLMTEILRKKIELIDKGRKHHNSPPKEYLDYFDYYLPATEPIFVSREVSILKNTDVIISNWLDNESNEDLLILIGNRGMGKSTTLDFLKRKYSEKADLSLSKIDQKILSAELIFIWLSKILSTPINNVDDIKLFDHQLINKKIILIDDIQNLFLSTINGFEAYKIFLEILNIKTNNILWILTVNSESWIYLKCVFGQEHFYGKELFFTPWKDFEIQQLIFLRHKQTGYERDFDESIKAFGSSDNSWDKAEVQFFRLLWGQARGNPRSALMYWISAISNPSSNTVHIEFPTFMSADLVANMSDDALFILAAIAKHDNLTHIELQKITCISDLIIRKCLKEACDKNLVWLDETERIRISSKAQYLIDYFLKGKNFL